MDIQKVSFLRSLSDVSYSDECRTKTVLSVCEKNASAFSCSNGKELTILLTLIENNENNNKTSVYHGTVSFVQGLICAS